MGALNFCPKRKQMHARKERNDLLFFLVPRLLDDPIFREKVVEMERAHPTEISIWDLTLTIHYNFLKKIFYRTQHIMPFRNNSVKQNTGRLEDQN